MVRILVDEPPPHDTHGTKASTIIGAAASESLFFFGINSHAEPTNTDVDISSMALGQESRSDPVPAIRGWVVPTFTVNDCDPLPLICTEELDKVQGSAGVTAGVTAQFRLTVPLNFPVAPTTRLKLAVCPAFIVLEVGDPEAGLIVNPGAVVLKSTAGPGNDGKTRSGWPSPFMSATSTP